MQQCAAFCAVVRRVDCLGRALARGMRYRMGHPWGSHGLELVRGRTGLERPPFGGPEPHFALRWPCSSAALVPSPEAGPHQAR